MIDLLELRKYTASKKLVIPGARTDAESPLVGTVSVFEPIELEAVRKSDDAHLWNEYVQRYHSLGYKTPFGAHQRYFIVSRTQAGYKRLGCLLFAASAWALADRDNWIGWSKADRSQRLCRENHWQFMIVLQDTQLLSVWEDAKGLHKLETANIKKQIYGNCNQDFWLVNNIKYRYQHEGKKKNQILHVVVCEESWEDLNARNEVVQKRSRHAWISSQPISQRKVHI